MIAIITPYEKDYKRWLAKEGNAKYEEDAIHVSCIEDTQDIDFTRAIFEYRACDIDLDVHNAVLHSIEKSERDGLNMKNDNK